MINSMNSIVAVVRALSGKLRVKVTVSGTVASTNLTAKPPVINIPLVPLNDDTVALVRGYIDHEVGHLRYTDGSAVEKMKNAAVVLHNLWNIFEDVFVERRMSDAFKGSRVNFENITDILFRHTDTDARLRDAVADPAAHIINYVLSSTRNLEYGGIDTTRQRSIVDQLFPGLPAKLDPLVGRSTTTRSSSECVQLAEDVYALLRNHVSESPQNQQDQQEAADKLREQLDEDSKVGNAGSGSSDMATMIGDKLGDASDDFVGAICDLDTSGQNKYAIPSADQEAGLRTSLKLRGRLAGMLQAKTLQYGQQAPKGTRVNPMRLASAMVDPRPEIFKRRMLRNDVDTHVMVLLDASYSMGDKNRMGIACAANYALALACQQRGVVFSVYSFGNYFTELLSPRERPNPAHMYVFPDGGTPLYEGAILAMLRFDPRCARKIMVLLTDGEAGSDSAKPIFFDTAKADDVELYGIGIQSRGILKVLPPERCKIIYSLDEFAPALFGVLEKSLLNRG